jgi:hypothetical protein
LQPRPEQIAKHHGICRKQTVRHEGFAAPAAAEPIGRQSLAEPQNQRAIPNGPGKANSIRCVRGEKYGMARRTDHVPVRRIVLREHAADRQHHSVRALPLDTAVRIRRRMRVEQADLQRLAYDQGLADDFHGPIQTAPEASATEDY